jgi:hypothetical protein
MLLKHPEHEIEECFLKGHLSLKPADRIECLYGLVAYHRTITKNYFKSYMYGKMALEIKTLPKRRFLFVEKDIYDYKLMCELANTCYHLGKNEDAYSLLSKSVAKKPDDASILNMMVLTNKLVSPLFELEKIDMIPPSCRVSGLTLVARYKSDIDLFIVSIKSLMKNAKDIHLVEKYILVIRNHDLQYLKEILNVFPYFVVVSYKEESEINSKLLEVLKDEDKFIFYIEDPWFCLLRKNYFAKPISFLARNPKYEQFIYIRNENSDPFEYKQQDNGKFILSDKIYENDLDHISTCPSIFRRSIYRNDTKNFKSCFLNQIQFVKLNKYY